MPGAGTASAGIESVIRRDWGRILSVLVRYLGDFALAEDCLQDAVLSAIGNWTRNGLPQSPDAWLLTVARRKALDRLRRDATFARKSAELAYLQGLEAEMTPDDSVDTIPDERLKLIFTCCHPAIEQKSRVALTLRALGGLTTEEIAAAFLDRKSAMAARLTRAKQKIAAAGIPYRVPEPEDLAERLGAVCQVVYLIFNEGYRSNAEQSLTRGDLTAEALRLGRLLLHLMPEEPEVAGLVSLMLLHDSRREARLDDAGRLVSLEQQDRDAWDRAKIAEGMLLLKRALSAGRDGPYLLQAAISAEHARAPAFSQTDWSLIVSYYDRLMDCAPNAVVWLNRSVALSFSAGPAAGLDSLNAFDDLTALEQYQPYHAARADMLARLGHRAAAIGAFDRAIGMSRSQSERELLTERRDILYGLGKT